VKTENNSIRIDFMYMSLFVVYIKTYASKGTSVDYWPVTAK